MDQTVPAIPCEESPYDAWTEGGEDEKLSVRADQTEVCASDEGVLQDVVPAGTLWCGCSESPADCAVFARPKWTSSQLLASGASAVVSLE